MVDASDAPTVIVDNGSGMMKAGLAGEEAPAVVFPSIVGRPKHTGGMHGVTQKNEYIGDEAQEKRGILTLKYPIANGIIGDWEDMNRVWHHTFYNELRIEPKDCVGCLVTEAPRNPKGNRQKMVEALFEQFEFNRAYIAIQAVMSLYANGRSTGLVVDSGDGVSHTVPVFEGFSIVSAIEKMEIAGRAITQWAARCLQQDGHSFTSSAELEIVKDIKEKLCYVAADYTVESETATSSSQKDSIYQMPDKRNITIPGATRIMIPELLFAPELNGFTCMSLQALTWSSVQKSDIDVRKDLLKSVIVSGGTTCYEGLSDRLKSEIQSQAPAGSEVRIIASADRKFSVWKGASTLASLSTFESSWISKEEYEEIGADVINRKCPA